MTKKIKVADYIANFIAGLGVHEVFMITGGGAMHLNEAFGSHPDIKYYCNHHEQASAIGAECYSRINGLGVCVVTTGPGGTNSLTGVVGAWLDSIPMIVISGQVKNELIKKNKSLRQLGVQELNIIDIVKPVTKYAVLVNKPEEIRYHLEKAVYLAKSGRPGPAWIDVPLDVQTSFVQIEELKGFKDTTIAPSPEKRILKDQVSEALNLLKNAKRPVILAGGGIRLAGAQADFLKLAEKLEIPVLTAMSSHDLIPSDHKLFFGRPGAFGGERAGNFIIQNSDLLISVGSRLHLWIISFDYKNFARDAKKVIVDIDDAELRKPTIKPDIPIQADAGEFIREMFAQTKERSLPNYVEWISYCKNIKQKYPVVLPEYKKQKKYVNSYYFIDVLSKVLPEKEIVVTSDGTAFSCTFQSFKIKKGQRLITNVGCAAMGYGLPAAIGASIAIGEKRVICLEGDGSIQLNIQELQTIVHYKLPVKIFVFNNNGYLAIRITQEAYFKSHYVGSGPESGLSFPDLLKIAKAYGIPAIRISNHKNIEKKIKVVVNSEGPTICEIIMDPHQPLIPKVTSAVKPDGKLISKPLEDMYPFLPREEFYKNMIIDPVEEL
ncbi:MAG: Thiamine pyrophosphate protein TPP binding domain protein [Berkelbacteria bacterium GW2011_GWA1_36_9]|uniref:Thiamine pyrophosphate protein TPP binding domain protein n=2 Tax=Bacteria candidate phyla TaxID=1783234 RepID=A0A0G0FCL5_9BACT|nr:MAG: Thiamine pyrophosphate protein TPP binding domain protein [Berkelbacteria bacterium GW2011_GWA1_36_9]KKQ91418.1 MAG: Thiamine pyrophosphate protein TPP binding domain protein [Candidatus Woesebacteria bacterium GW2011_GWB1_39_10]